MLINPSEIVEELRQGQSRELVNKLARENPMVREELLRIFAQADPGIFIRPSAGPVRLIIDEKLKEVSNIVGLAPTHLREQKLTPKLITEPALSTLSLPKSIPDMQSLSLKEFEFFCSSYFSDATVRKTLLALFWREKDFQEENIKYDLYALYSKTSGENQEFETNNIHSLGKTLKKESWEKYIQRKWKGEERRDFSQEYSFQKVQKQHSSALRNTLGLRQLYALASQLGLRKTHIIDFPGIFQQQEVLQKPLPENTQEIGEKVFISTMIELAHLQQNMSWFMGERKQIFVPPEIEYQFKRLQEMEIALGLFNFHAHRDSLLASIIAYYNPSLISYTSRERIEALEKNEGMKYPSPQDIALETPKKGEEKKESQIRLEMKPKVAEKYGFIHPATLTCLPELLEYIFSLGDEEPVIFTMQEKNMQISAKMFRRIFHRNITPEKEECNNVIYMK